MPAAPVAMNGSRQKEKSTQVLVRGLKNFLLVCRDATFRFSLTRTVAWPALLRRSARRFANIE
jgi:hypothetical protein